MVASADTLPVLTWSGVTNATGGFYVYPANADATPNGLSVSDSWYGVVGSGNSSDIQNNYDATTAFTVTSAGYIQLSGIGSFDLDASTCSDVPGCVKIGADLQPLEIDITTSVSILGSLGNTVATESFTGSAAALYGGCELFPDFDQEACTASAQLNANTPNGIFDLPTGTYTLDVDVTSDAANIDGNVVIGLSQLEGDVLPVPTPTPEPREWWALLSLSAVLCAAKMRLGRKGPECPK